MVFWSPLTWGYVGCNNVTCCNTVCNMGFRGLANSMILKDLFCNVTRFTYLCIYCYNGLCYGGGSLRTPSPSQRAC